MTDSRTEMLMDTNEPTQTGPIYILSDEDTEAIYRKTDHELTKNGYAQWLNQFVIHSKDPSVVAEC